MNCGSRRDRDACLTEQQHPPLIAEEESKLMAVPGPKGGVKAP
jgi:hypothetical protein